MTCPLLRAHRGLQLREDTPGLGGLLDRSTVAFVELVRPDRHDRERRREEKDSVEKL